MKISITGLIFSLLCTPLFAQISFEPDTNLTYERFLRQCQDFSRTTESEVWVVNFWASWHGGSLDMVPQLKQVYEAYATRKPVRFISISIDKNKQQWLNGIVNYQLPWEHLFLPNQQDLEFLRTAFRHNSIPALFVVDTKGDIHRMQDIPSLQQELDFQITTLPDEPYATLVAAPEPVTPAPTPTPTQPDPEPEPEPEPETSQPRDSGTWVTHTVRPGETLYSLYRKYQVPVDDIKRNNGLNGNTIKVGEVLKIKLR